MTLKESPECLRVTTKNRLRSMIYSGKFIEPIEVQVSPIFLNQNN